LGQILLREVVLGPVLPDFVSHCQAP
jgi:hypothetical protein